MDGGPVGDPAHLTAEGVDLLDELALGEAADRGIAGHERKGIEVDVEQKGLAAHPGRREGRLAARMTASDDDDVVFVHILPPPGLHPIVFISRPLMPDRQKTQFTVTAQASGKSLQFLR